MYLKCDYTARIVRKGKKFEMIVRAHPRKDAGRQIDIARFKEDGSQLNRNMYFTYMGGYTVYMDELEKWSKPWVNFRWNYCTSNGPCYCVNPEKICEIYPMFKYILQKINRFRFTALEMWKIFILWKKHPKIEFLLAQGYYNIALNENFWKMSEKKKKEIFSFISQNEPANYTLLEIQQRLKLKITSEEWAKWQSFRPKGHTVPYDVYKFTQGDYHFWYTYNDYLSMMKKDFPERLNDDYWLYPNDLKERHDKMVEEAEAKKILQDKEKRLKKQLAYSKAIEGLEKLKVKDGDVEVFVPEKIEDIELQAKKLNQCLVSCDYIQSVIDGKCVLVFVRKAGEPIATAEILGRSRIGQFYGDEEAEDIYPPQFAKKALNQWLKLRAN